jgi:hypothetical protein
MEPSFPQFREMPIEIRLIVWGYTLHPRSVIVDHNVDVITRENCIREEVPVLLSVNKEARQYAQANLTSVFKAPRSEWQYTGSLKSADLRKALKVLGLPQKGTITGMLQTISKFMNSGLHEKGFAKFAKHQDISKDIIQPQWFNPKTDTIVFRFPIYLGQQLKINDSLLWSPWRRIEAEKIRRIAFSVDALNSSGRRYEGQRIWTRNASNLDKPSNEPKAAALESLNILVGDACEVLSLEVDQKNLLKPREWAFRLDTEDDEFMTEMGPRWASVVWRIILAKRGKSTLWELVKEVSVNGIL